MNQKTVDDAIRKVLDAHRANIHTYLMNIAENVKPGDKLWLDVTENLPGVQVSDECVRDIVRAVMWTALGKMEIRIREEGKKK